MTDQIERKPAATNPWYVLMTVAGEQGEHFDEALHARNRRYWNGWAAEALSDNEIARLIDEGRATGDDLKPLSEDERAALTAAVRDRAGQDVPDAGAYVDCTFTDFDERVSCIGFVFSGHAFFRSATFSGVASFQRATFSGYADFKSATFSVYADFESATFSGVAAFQSAALSGYADFQSATLSDYADFQSATFSDYTSFRRAAFSGYAAFQSATFLGAVRFQNAKFRSSVIFKAVTFKTEPPQFYETELHEDTNWAGVDWPDVPKDPDAAYDHRRAYERLRLMMDGQKKFQDEHRFLTRGFRCQEVEDGCPKNLVSKFFRGTSDYGGSMRWPAVWLAGTLLAGLALMMTRFWWAGACPADLGGPAVEGCWWSSLALSFSNTFGFLGLGRVLLSDELKALDEFPWLEVLAGAQFFLGPLFLFLFGLGLRNRFRMR